MALTTAAPVKQAIVVALRANTALRTEVAPPNPAAHGAVSGFYEGFAPAKKPYPFVVYQLVYNAYDFLWEAKALSRSAVDVSVFSQNAVEANNLDLLVIQTLHDAQLAITGQSLLYLRRISDISSVDEDEEGNRVYQIGGTYQIWTDQSL